MFARTTPSPTWQSCARCTYDNTKLFGPTLVLNDCEVPRLMVLYSRTTVLSPISTVVRSPLNLRSCGSLPRTVPTPIFTFRPSITKRSRVARADITQPSPITQSSPTIANGPISTPSPSSADDDTIAVGWILAVIDPAPSRPSLPQRRAPRQPSQRRASCTPRLGSG